MYYIPRKRIQGFSLLYVFVLLLHGPWCQLRLSVQWNQADGMAAGYSALFLDLWGAHQIWGWPFHTYLACYEIHSNFPSPVIINDFKLANITMLLRVLRNMVESSDKTWSTGEGNGKPLQYSCLENPMNSMKRWKDRTLKDELPRSVGAQYTTGEE